MSEVADGPDTSVSGRAFAYCRLQALDRLGQQPDHLIGLYHAQVEVGHERECAPPRVLAAVEHDRAGLCDGHRSAGERAVEAVEIGRRELGVLHQLHAAGAPLTGKARRHAQPRHVVLAAGASDRVGHAARRTRVTVAR